MTLLTPVRVYDSRDPSGLLGGRKHEPGLAPSIPVGAYAGGGLVLGVFINLTVTETESAGYLTVVPEDGSGERPVPLVSNLNWWTSGLTLGNACLVHVGDENSVAVLTRGGTAGAPPRAHVIIDLQGYVPYIG